MPEAIPIACSLDQEKLTNRGQEMAALGRAMTGIRAAGREAELRFPVSRRDEIENFVRVESSCCPFFEFSLSEAEGELELAIGAPDGADWAVRGLIARFAAGWDGLA